MTSPDRPVESPAELLERAAVRLEELAHWATPLPWGSGEELTATLKILGTDAAWISTMSPAVAAPLVAWLRYESRTMRLDIMGSGDTACTWKYVADRYGPAIAFARLILGESDG